MAVSAYYDGVKAGAGAIDCAISSMAGFSSQPPVETMVAMFSETEFEVNLDVEALRKVNKYFADLNPKRSKGRGHESIIDSEILIHQIPGGMISNFRSQLEQQGAIEKLSEALEEVSRVRKDLGYPPLVTPTSQIVGTQAVMNVISGERYKMVPQEVKNYVKGMYGLSPAPIDPALVKKILGDEKPIGHRPADDLKPILPTATKNISNPKLIHNEEDIISYCLFPEVATEFFKWRALPEDKRPKSPVEIENEDLIKDISAPKNNGKQEPMLPLLNAEDYTGLNSIIERASRMQLNEITIRKGEFNLSLRSGNGTASKSFATSIVEEGAPMVATEVDIKEVEKPKVTETVDASDTINAIMAGTFYRGASESVPPFVEEGSVIETGDTICILEAMKLFNEIQSPVKCKIVKVLLENGTKVTKGQPLMAIQKL
jgi:oxaloacetate decarboxylase alpha subunit